MKHKLDFDEAFSLLCDERTVRASDVLAHAQERIVWVSEWHMPGCMSESCSYSLNKNDAIAAALDMASGADGPPKGMLADLRYHHRSRRTAPDALFPGAITTITRTTLGALLS